MPRPSIPVPNRSVNLSKTVDTHGKKDPQQKIGGLPIPARGYRKVIGTPTARRFGCARAE